MITLAKKINGTCSTGHEAEGILLTLEESRKLVDFFARNIDWIETTKITIKPKRKVTLAGIWPTYCDMVVFGEENLVVGILLHELTHYKSINHDAKFVYYYKELLEIWEMCSEEIFPPKFVSSLKEVIEYIIDEASEGEKITKLFVGEELKESGLNTVENFNHVVSELSELGVNVN